MTDLKSVFVSYGSRESQSQHDVGPDWQNITEGRHRLSKMTESSSGKDTEMYVPLSKQPSNSKVAAAMDLELTRIAERRAKGKWFAKSGSVNATSSEIIAQLEARYSQSVFETPTPCTEPIGEVILVGGTIPSETELAFTPEEIDPSVREIFARSPLADEPWCSELDELVFDQFQAALLTDTREEEYLSQAVGSEPVSNAMTTSLTPEIDGTQCMHVFALDGETLAPSLEPPTVLRPRAKVAAVEVVGDWSGPRKKKRGRRRAR